MYQRGRIVKQELQNENWRIWESYPVWAERYLKIIKVCKWLIERN
jgi:hypothetical protein